MTTVRYLVGDVRDRVDIDDRNVALARKRVGEHAHVRDEPDGTWTCEPRLPNQAAQIDGQLSMLGGEA